MESKLVKQIKDNDILRQSFINLAIKVFDLSFENWYHKGYWTDKYIPYSLIENNQVMANASVNIISTVWEGVSKRYVQIGTVMTDPEYRGRGFSRRLIEEILVDWRDQCDHICLYANSTVIDYYPKFGFVPVTEHKYIIPAVVTEPLFSLTKLSMDTQEDKKILENCYKKSNPFSMLPMQDNYGLLMFYCDSIMKDNIYYFKELDMVCIAVQEDDTLVCYDIFGEQNSPMESIISSLVTDGTKKIRFGFTPKVCENGYLSKTSDIETGETLFILNDKENIFSTYKVMFPVLSHA